ncbi:hypothetical protein [Rhodococcus sovatensis]|uniref:SWIM-type domain-containing protein n=1 Tax=Rhodococcus sovatensis TaxID=1805840 RepID=A0ABZ2PLU4_9NOCA
MTVRPDLSALTDDALTVVANRGLLKRALRVQSTEPPTLTVSEHAVVARYADGVETTLPAECAFTDASCTCGATGMCRHRVGLVVAYRQLHPAAASTVWSPGEFDDEALLAYLGVSAIRRAEKIRRAGYSATVHRPRGDDPAVRVELPHSTVSFLVPHELTLARSSASDEATMESIALAVWAVREADAHSTDTVHVGGSTIQENTTAEAALLLARTVLVDGVARLTEVQRVALRRTVRSIQAGTAVWLADACVELLDQVDAYCSRHARHNRTRAATVIAEIDARVKVGQSRDSAAAATALGTDTPSETPLRRTRLVALGAHVTGVGANVCADVYFAEPGSGTVHLLRREWTEHGGGIPTGHALSKRRISGTTVEALASSTVVTESAVRQANHRIRFARRGIGRTAIMPLSSDTWTKSLTVVTDYAAEYTRLAGRTPSVVGERVLTRGVGVVRVESVLFKEYSPESQQLTMQVHDERGSVAQIVVDYRSYAPRAMDAVDEALSTGQATVAGRLSIRNGVLQISPFGVAGARGVVVPDLEAPGTATSTLPARTGALQNAPDAALELLADLAHKGFTPRIGNRRHPPSTVCHSACRFRHDHHSVGTHGGRRHRIGGPRRPHERVDLRPPQAHYRAGKLNHERSPGSCTAGRVLLNLRVSCRRRARCATSGRRD